MPLCHGTGQVETQQRTPSDIRQRTPCRRCGGTGRKIEKACSNWRVRQGQDRPWKSNHARGYGTRLRIAGEEGKGFGVPGVFHYDRVEEHPLFGDRDDLHAARPAVPRWCSAPRSGPGLEPETSISPRDPGRKTFRVRAGHAPAQGLGRATFTPTFSSMSPNLSEKEGPRQSPRPGIIPSSPPVCWTGIFHDVSGQSY